MFDYYYLDTKKKLMNEPCCLNNIIEAYETDTAYSNFSRSMSMSLVMNS